MQMTDVKVREKTVNGNDDNVCPIKSAHSDIRLFVEIKTSL